MLRAEGAWYPTPVTQSQPKLNPGKQLFGTAVNARHEPLGLCDPPADTIKPKAHVVGSSLSHCQIELLIQYVILRNEGSCMLGVGHMDDPWKCASGASWPHWRERFPTSPRRQLGRILVL